MKAQRAIVLRLQGGRGVFSCSAQRETRSPVVPTATRLIRDGRLNPENRFRRASCPAPTSSRLSVVPWCAHAPQLLRREAWAHRAAVQVILG
jgi:hypothetical protein